MCAGECVNVFFSSNFFISFRYTFQNICIYGCKICECASFTNMLRWCVMTLLNLLKKRKCLTFIWIKCNINRQQWGRLRRRRFGSPYRSSLILSPSHYRISLILFFFQMYEQLDEFITAVCLYTCVIGFAHQKCYTSKIEKWVIWFLVEDRFSIVHYDSRLLMYTHVCH